MKEKKGLSRAVRELRNETNVANWGRKIGIDRMSALRAEKMGEREEEFLRRFLLLFELSELTAEEFIQKCQKLLR